MQRGRAVRRSPGWLSLALLPLLLPAACARPANLSALRGREELLPPEHLNGVRLERDGHLNRELPQELFLGRERERFEEDSQPRRNRRKLVGIFAKVDRNNDQKISAKEMQRWIMEKTEEHFQEAVQENKMHFRAVDPDGDGHVSWDEYKIKFLASKGFNEKEIAEKIKNNEELKIDEETQEVLDNLKDRWYQADNPPPDLLLSEQEFLSFLHPEHSRGMLHFMVQEIVRDLDQDGDKRLTLPEFISLPVGTVENQQAQDVDDDWVRDRRKEFQEVIDANRDGIVTMEELEEYMDPMNEHNALNEARQMIAVADENQDHQLELEEVLKYSEYFTGSKLMDYARNVHEEF
ncbi:calcium-binding protein [Lonchura striata]|uniref:45 kDa calcium-binding protein n=1 Tax=Lonchura striata TaxID=40157 RepID=A0A218UIW7_9PASE|nr:45 kDa calcium-binding protein [Lonchura striata domestica]XP_021393439.1 45 kDa calcium-binding protein [Lonchura striata domestica]XP_021393440.1 45 kDa calcium-binding protein [Lonchura striata domestica]OWK53312.1 calcium-binding protein [Lonchura striata domestica]